MKKSRRVPDLFVEQLLLGELPQRRKAQLEGDPEVRRRLEELKASNDRILADHPPGEMARRIEERARSSRPAPALRRSGPAFRFAGPALRFAGPAVGIAALFVVAGLLVLNLYPGLRAAVSVAGARVDQIRLKGGTAHLVLYRQTADGAEPLRPNDVARPGDLLQIGYVVRPGRHGVIVSLDGAGAVTVHLPAAGCLASPLAPEAETLLPFPYELDDAPGFERFFLVSAAEPFGVQAVVAAVRALRAPPGEEAVSGPAAGTAGRLDLPKSMEQDSFLLRKGD